MGSEGRQRLVGRGASQVGVGVPAGMGGWTRSAAGWGRSASRDGWVDAERRRVGAETVGRDGSGAERRGLMSECQQGFGGGGGRGASQVWVCTSAGMGRARSVAGGDWVRAGACVCEGLTWGGSPHPLILLFYRPLHLLPNRYCLVVGTKLRNP